MHLDPALRRHWTVRAVLVIALAALGGLLAAFPAPAALTTVP